MTALQWTAIALVCLGLEIASAGFWFMWLAIAGFLTAILTFFGVLSGITSQFLLFALVSLVLVVFTRPLLMKAVRVKDTHSNTEALIGKTGLVTAEITAFSFGQVKVNGEIWTAAAEEPIPEGTRIRVSAIDGVKLRVEPLPLESSEH